MARSEAHCSSESNKGVGSLDAHLYGCIIQRTYGFGLAPLTRGKLYQEQEWEQRQCERLREFAKRALIHRTNLADQTLGIEQARL